VSRSDAAAEAPERPVKVVVVDDQTLVRGGFAAILGAQPDVEVVGEAADGAQAVQLVRRLQPDVVLMDVRMPGMDGLTATKQLTAMPGLATRIVILTTFDADDYVYRALKAGATGYLLKDVAPRDLVAAVRAAAAGEALLAPTVTRRLIERYVSMPPPGETAPALAELTDRERDVLVLLARGLSNAEIGEKLWVSHATVKTHVARLLAKLGLRDRVQAVVTAYETGLVRPGG
jgi:DNA-binding NarL/FixJ family response regulator